MKSSRFGESLKYYAGCYPAAIEICIAICFAACNSPLQKRAAPDEHHFKKVVLAEGLPRPVMLDIDANNRIFVAESGGDIMIFDQKTGQFKKAGAVPTYDRN